MRYITLDENNIVVAFRVGTERIGNEIESDEGNVGQRMLEDGSFIDVEKPERIYPPTQEDEILFETKYQTLLIEAMILGGINQ